MDNRFDLAPGRRGGHRGKQRWHRAARFDGLRIREKLSQVIGTNATPDLVEARRLLGKQNAPGNGLVRGVARSAVQFAKQQTTTTTIRFVLVAMKPFETWNHDVR
jgi:hypothetical protein